MASTSKTSVKTTAYLKTIIGNPVGEIFPLTSGEVTIGRNRQSAQICMRDPNVSRSHCSLKYSENGWFIKDLESVNGTYLDGKMLEIQKFYPLKDGAGIYLGPPGEAPAAFVFLTKMPNEQSYETNMKSCNQKNRRNTHIPVLVSNKSDNKSIKRPPDSESSNTNEGFSQRKKKAASSSSSTTPPSQYRDILDEIEDDNNLSDFSISSLDSLKTRLRKLSARKTKNRNTRKRDAKNAASSSASPQLRPSSNASVESKPSTSTTPVEMLESKKHKSKEPAISKEFALLNTIFNESESSTPETIKGDEDSESLLNDSKMLIDCDPYPFSQPILTETPKKVRNKNEKRAESDKKGPLEEQLKKATLELKKLKDDKLYLSRLVKELKSEEFLKMRVQGEFQKILEDELMCNICTEIFMKAVTLSCSHTFCEHCISEWKKKQKKCPICREKITSETKVLVLDSFINKAVDHLDAETQKRRKELMASREKAKATKQKKKSKRSRGRGRRIRSDSSEAEELRQLHGETSNSIGVQIRFSGNSSPSIQVIREDDIGELGSDFSDGSDISVEGSGYYGGYGRCYNCGRSGHWANGCPF